MKNKIKKAFGWSLYQIANIFCREENFLSIYFHAPSPELFEQIVLWLKKKKYRIIDINECYDILSNKMKLEEKVAYLSFDDGWQSNMELIPIIEKHNVPITIFVATEPIVSGNYWWEYAGKAGGANKISYMKKLEQREFLKELSLIKSDIELRRSSITEEDLDILVKHPLVSIQSHTVTHPILINCSQETLDKELIESKKYLEEKTGEEIYAFSYPNGGFGLREVKAVKNAGYKIAFTTKPDILDTTTVDDILLVPRRSINSLDSLYVNLARIKGIWQKIKR